MSYFPSQPLHYACVCWEVVGQRLLSCLVITTKINLLADKLTVILFQPPSDHIRGHTRMEKVNVEVID